LKSYRQNGKVIALIGKVTDFSRGQAKSPASWWDSVGWS